jgi:hypothetical protein
MRHARDTGTNDKPLPDYALFALSSPRESGRSWLAMPRAISKTDIDFGLIRIGADEVWVWMASEAKQLIVGSREFELSRLSSEQLYRLEAMASAVSVMGNASDAVRRDLTVLADELIRQHTH